MPLPLNNVSPGDPITSADWNVLVDFANFFRTLQQGKLEIQTDVRIKGDSGFASGTTATLCIGDDEHFIQAKRDFGLTIKPQWAPTGLVIRKGGDAAFGTTEPRGKLEIYGGDDWLNHAWQKNLLLTANLAPSLAFTLSADGPADVKFGVGMKENAGLKQLQIFSSDPSLAAPLLFDNSSGGGDPIAHLVVQQTGKVGIGDTNPDAKLVVSQNSSFEWTTKILNNGAAGRGLLIQSAIASSPNALIDAQLLDGTSRFKVMADGNVGIGITTPGAKLEIGGGPSWTTNGWKKSIKLVNGSAIQFDAGVNKFGIGASQSGDSLFFFSTQTDSSVGTLDYRLRIQDTGELLVTGGAFPIRFERFTKTIPFPPVPTGDVNKIDTGYSSGEYNAGIVGIIQNNNITNIPRLKFYMSSENGEWTIRGPITILETKIDVIFVRKEISSSNY